MKLLRVLLFAILSLVAFAPAHGQIGVQISLKRRIFILHEPIIATVTLTNMSGREITLEDTPELQWFGFQINGARDSIVAPRHPDYHLGSIEMHPGETVRRTVNLNQLYDFGDFGTFKVRAAIYLAPAQRYFTSRPEQIELTDGKVVWRQLAGVPEGNDNAGQTHVFTLLSHARDDGRILYVRIEDKDNGSVFCTYPLGRLIEGVPAQAEFDRGNNLYVLQLIGQKAYALSKISVNGEFMGQTNYSAPKSRPTLRKLADGTLQIIGGRKENPVADVPAGPPTKLSDRPPGLPQ